MHGSWVSTVTQNAWKPKWLTQPNKEIEEGTECEARFSWAAHTQKSRRNCSWFHYPSAVWCIAMITYVISVSGHVICVTTWSPAFPGREFAREWDWDETQCLGGPFRPSRWLLPIEYHHWNEREYIHNVGWKRISSGRFCLGRARRDVVD